MYLDTIGRSGAFHVFCSHAAIVTTRGYTAQYRKLYSIFFRRIKNSFGCWGGTCRMLTGTPSRATHLHCFVACRERLRYIFETAIWFTRFLFYPASACPDCFVAFQLCLRQYHLTKLDSPQSTTVRDRHIVLQPWEMCRVQAPRLVPDEEGGAEIEVLHPRGPHGAAFVLPNFSQGGGHIWRRMNECADGGASLT